MPKYERVATETVEKFVKSHGTTHGILVVVWPLGEDLHKADIQVCHSNSGNTEEALGIATMGLTRLANSVYEASRRTTEP